MKKVILTALNIHISYYEKIKNEVHCIDSELPFKFLFGWAYERLGNICSVARGGSPRPIEDYLTDDENGLNWIKISDTKQGGKYIYSQRKRKYAGKALVKQDL